MNRISSILSLTLCSLFAFNFAAYAKTLSVSDKTWVGKEVSILTSETNINPQVLRLSLIAYSKARAQGLDQKQILSVIDYSLPSAAKRLWVFDLNTNRVLFNTYVAHGKNSGGNTPSSFSNSVGSLKSSLGVFVTQATTYIGRRGIALRERGLEPGFNDNAYRRDVVFHGAPYVSSNIAKSTGRVGKSWGCPAVPQDLARPLINTIKNNTIVFAYYPDPAWLSRSHFLSA